MNRLDGGSHYCIIATEPTPFRMQARQYPCVRISDFFAAAQEASSTPNVPVPKVQDLRFALPQLSACLESIHSERVHPRPGGDPASRSTQDATSILLSLSYAQKSIVRHAHLPLRS